ncbi:MAG: 50S ribosomal protein L9 [Acidobacteria bacterium]|jgi:large subunit ribosomal protein L9|nr:50S ribosomal protein L9 [Acidobacteriota bacterium]
MEVILRADVPKLGHRGEVVTVAEGYARNYLLPRKIAVMASAGNKKVIQQEKTAAVRREVSDKAQAEQLAKMLADVTVVVARKAGEEDQLYGSVTSIDVAEALQAKGYTVDRRKIHVEDPIRTLGEFQVPLRLHHDVEATVKLQVVRETE